MTSRLQKQIVSLLEASPADSSVLTKVLQLVLTQFQSETGTLHLLDPQTQLLNLAAESGLPPAVREVVKVIPIGKGIAGQAAARGEPVTICNLQTDTSGVARPGAQQTGVGGALCVPLWQGDRIVGTLGVGTRRQYEYTSEEVQTLEDLGQALGRYLARFPS